MDVRISSMAVCSFSSVLPFNARKKNHIIWPWAQNLIQRANMSMTFYTQVIQYGRRLIFIPVNFRKNLKRTFFLLCLIQNRGKFLQKMQITHTSTKLIAKYLKYKKASDCTEMEKIPNSSYIIVLEMWWPGLSPQETFKISGTSLSIRNSQLETSFSKLPESAVKWHCKVLNDAIRLKQYTTTRVSSAVVGLAHDVIQTNNMVSSIQESRNVRQKETKNSRYH